MKVLALASYPIESAATRYRLIQFIEPLAEREISLVVRPFLDSRSFANLYRREALPQNVPAIFFSLLSRIKDLLTAGRFDALLIQREAMMFGPPVFEWLSLKLGRLPMILDLDDATYVRYVSPTFGRVGSWLKFFGKTDDLISWASVVTCGNQTIAEYVEKKNKKAEIIPTVVNTNLFSPKPEVRSNDKPVIGWVGTHSTYPYLQEIFPVLQDLAEEYDFRLKIVGSGVDKINLPGVAVENLVWNLEREAADFQSFDVGLYPIDDALHANWAAGKSGFKAIQYMSVGIPYVVTPIGVCGEIGQTNKTHLTAQTLEDWGVCLGKLLEDSQLRDKMGKAGRDYALTHFTVPQQADKLARILREAVGK